MHPHGPVRSFYWPQKEDLVWVPLALILTKIECPTHTLVSVRGSYKFEKQHLDRILGLRNAFQNEQSSSLNRP